MRTKINELKKITTMPKKITTILLLIGIMLASCETPIGLDLQEGTPKLVVDASINWQKGTPGNEQMIKLTTTGNYFAYQVPVVSGATVSVQNTSGTTFDFLETPGTGEYVCDTFIPAIGETYTLTVLYNGQTLTASETMIAVPPIDKVEQEISAGIGSDQDRIDIKTFFTDPGNTNDFYLTRVQTSINAIPQYRPFDDEFFQGNQIFDLYINPDLKPGNILDIRLSGISERYFNYMTILASIAGTNGGPFATPPATLKGNVLNTTHPDDLILGYFSVSEIDKRVYVVQ
jgi:hypothetical protein